MTLWQILLLAMGPIGLLAAAAMSYRVVRASHREDARKPPR